MSLTQERHFPLSTVLKLDPRTAELHPRTAKRWHARGVRRPDGTVVRLECSVVGARTFTSHEALDRFLAMLNAAPAEAAGVRSPHQRRSASDAASAELDALGA